MSRDLYCELVTGSLTARGNIVLAYQARPSDDRRECYRSMFLHDWRLRDWVEVHKTVTGFSGPHTAEQFVLDVDCEDDLSRAQIDATNIIRRLIAYYDVPANAIRPSFSGAKGFHIAIPAELITPIREPRKNFSKGFAGLARDIADGMESVDLVIYEPKRILRMANTINAKTGLYKIPLTINELETLTIDEIREKASASRSIAYTEADEFGVVASLNEIFEKHIAERDPAPAPAERTQFLEMFNGVQSGGRNSALSRLAGLLISKGIDAELAIALLTPWNKTCTPPLAPDEFESTVRGEYARYASATNAPEIYNLREMGERYARHIEQMKLARVKTGFPPLDDKIRGIAPGEVLCVLGKTSVGKSAFAQYVAKMYAQDSGQPTLFFSLEMPLESVFERDYQMESGCAGYDVERAFDVDAEEIARRIEFAYSATPNFYTCETATMDIDAIKAHIRYAEDNIYHARTGLVLVDYLGLVIGKGKDVYEQISGIARSMKNIAKELHVPIMYLVQVNRRFTIYDELELGAARDSGSIDEAADYIVGIWSAPKERQDLRDKVRLVTGIVKNRKGGKANFETLMDKRSLRFEMQDNDPVRQQF